MLKEHLNGIRLREVKLNNYKAHPTSDELKSFLYAKENLS